MHIATSIFKRMVDTSSSAATSQRDCVTGSAFDWDSLKFSWHWYFISKALLPYSLLQYFDILPHFCYFCNSVESASQALLGRYTDISYVLSYAASNLVHYIYRRSALDIKINSIVWAYVSWRAILTQFYAGEVHRLWSSIILSSRRTIGTRVNLCLIYTKFFLLRREYCLF